ncbi:stromal membrane-associated protein 1 isoform X1 [Halyomorpha halys]|uniref:stromal membrane-associated protein 1 isoform X1 n=1 Tax=Halyomorpha halys TaxID=286706 RepID=UPI0006D511A8|nr:stromal membrane-associated protein 1-like isoform X1 [Halyomorpha halys]
MEDKYRMSTRSEKDRSKQIQDKCQSLLTQMLRDEDNKYCVDCDAKGPRWASWNLGIFLCIRCAGIHRNLGVHISKVKSVNLDTWTPEQVVSLQQMGNSRARAVYEANLPDSFRRPQTDSALESFIRAKYETKKYIAQEWVPPPLPKINWDKELDEEAERARKKKREIKNTVPIPVPKKIDVIPQALPKPHSSPKNREGKSRNRDSIGATDLLGLDTPTSDLPSNSDDVFTSFLSAAPVSKRSQEEESFFNQSLSPPATSSNDANSTSSQGTASSGKLTTDSILALYAKGPPIPVNNFVQPQQQQFPYTSSQHQPIPVPMFQPNVVGMNITSNPFYSMQQAQQPQLPVTPTVHQNQQVDLSQQLSSLNINGGAAKYQKSSMSNHLWQ